MARMCFVVRAKYASARGPRMPGMAPSKTMTSVLSLSGLVLGVVVLLLDEVLSSRLLQSMSALALVSRKPPTTAVGYIGV